MRWIAGAMFAGALGAGVAALPDSGATDWNREMATACANARAVRPFAECPEPKREAMRTDWLLIAAVLAMGGAVVLAVSARKG
jgi:hypothetical protein